MISRLSGPLKEHLNLRGKCSEGEHRKIEWGGGFDQNSLCMHIKFSTKEPKADNKKWKDTKDQ